MPFSEGQIQGFYSDLYFAYLKRVAVQFEKIGSWNSGFMKVGPQSVNMSPERDSQQSTKQNPMFILIFYIYSRLSDLWAGRQKFFAHA